MFQEVQGSRRSRAVPAGSRHVRDHALEPALVLEPGDRRELPGRPASGSGGRPEPHDREVRAHDGEHVAVRVPGRRRGGARARGAAPRGWSSVSRTCRSAGWRRWPPSTRLSRRAAVPSARARTAGSPLRSRPTTAASWPPTAPGPCGFWKPTIFRWSPTGINPAEVILEHTMASYGFASLEQAEAALRAHAERTGGRPA